MGAGQSGSSRTVTIENENPLVDVSEAVVSRLRGQLAKGQEEARRNASQGDQRETTTPQGSTTNQPQQPPPSSVPSSYGNPTQKPAVVYYGEPTITAIEVRRQKEIELRNNDLYWAKRLTQLEQNLQKTNSILEKEYNSAVEDVRSRFQNAPPQHQTPPCREFKTKLIECYRKHPNETLWCSQQVDEFTHCVNAHRAKLLDEKHQAINNKADAVAATKVVASSTAK